MGQLAKEGYIKKFQAFIKSPKFPCVGAKSANAHDAIEYFVADDMRSGLADRQIVKALQEFAQKANSDSMFVSFAVIFPDTPSLSENEFEYLLWERLQAFHEIDYLDFDWDREVSSDPESKHFSMSIGGKSFYVVGLHPDASRPARQFNKPTLIFNLHSQFESLKEKGSYEKIQQTIQERDMKINGSINPMLADHGTKSEALQYSGRKLEKEWKCPFHALFRSN